MPELMLTTPFRWLSRWREALDVCLAAGGSARPLVLEPHATESEVASVEGRLDVRLPESFRSVLLGFSAAVDLSWFMPSDFKFPEPFHEILSGGCRWSLPGLVEIETARRSLEAERFPNDRDPGAALWRNKLAFSEMANGDYLALDLTPDAPGAVHYLSPGDGDAHGYRLGQSFEEFVSRWSELGCPGTEGRQMMPFLDDPASSINCDGAAARQWRDVFGLSEKADSKG